QVLLDNRGPRADRIGGGNGRHILAILGTLGCWSFAVGLLSLQPFRGFLLPFFHAGNFFLAFLKRSARTRSHSFRLLLTRGSADRDCPLLIRRGDLTSAARAAAGVRRRRRRTRRRRPANDGSRRPLCRLPASDG